MTLKKVIRLTVILSGISVGLLVVKIFFARNKYRNIGESWQTRCLPAESENEYY